MGCSVTSSREGLPARETSHAESSMQGKKGRWVRLGRRCCGRRGAESRGQDRTFEKFQEIHFLFFINLFIWQHCDFVAARAFSSCSERGLLFVAVHGLLIAVASLVAEHGL